MSLKIFFFLFLFLFNNNCLFCVQAKTFTLMIDPAGDARYPGRIIEDSFERGITLQYAEKLKKLLEQHDFNVRVILTRFPGESVEPLQNAHFANRLEVDLYLSIHFYYEREAKPQLSLFHFINNPTDSWRKPSTELIFESYDNAHITNLSSTKECARLLKKSLERPEYNHLFDVKGLFGIPFKPLIGIVCPALGIEASLKAKEQWMLYLEPVIQSLLYLIKNLRSNHG